MLLFILYTRLHFLHHRNKQSSTQTPAKQYKSLPANRPFLLTLPIFQRLIFQILLPLYILPIAHNNLFPYIIQTKLKISSLNIIGMVRVELTIAGNNIPDRFTIYATSPKLLCKVYFWNNLSTKLWFTICFINHRYRSLAEEIHL